MTSAHCARNGAAHEDGRAGSDCGVGETDTGRAVIDVWNKMSALDKTTASTMRMNIRVCEADTLADTCSGFNTPAVDL